MRKLASEHAEKSLENEEEQQDLKRVNRQRGNDASHHGGPSIHLPKNEADGWHHQHGRDEQPGAQSAIYPQPLLDASFRTNPLLKAQEDVDERCCCPL